MSAAAEDAVGQPWKEGEEPPPAEGEAPPADAPPPEAVMEAKVKSPPAGGVKRVGKWSIDQLRQTDGIIPLQYGTNKFDSQKGMTKFGTPRNNTTRVKNTVMKEVPEELVRLAEKELRLQSGSNQFASQKGMTGMGSGRDVAKQGYFNKIDPADVAPLSEEKALASEGVVRLQSGTNKYDSQKGMTGIGTARREVTKMKDTKHPEYLADQSIDQSVIPVQMGTNKFDSQKGMTGFGTNRRETTKMKDEARPDINIEHPDQKTIPLQSGTNKFASQKGMTAFNAKRLETMNPMLSHQNRKSQGTVRYQMGSNLYASQKNMTSFGMPRDVRKWADSEGQDLTYEDVKKSETVIPSQAGWNKGDSQKGTSGFGASRDVKGKHLKRLWELEFPEEAEAQLGQ